MFSFWHHKKQGEVHRILTGRMNQRCLADLRPGERKNSRTPICEVTWLIPNDAAGQPNFGAALAAVGRDVSVQGLSLIHTEPLADAQVLVALRGESLPIFLRCRREHSTPLGYGFYQIGLFPEEVVQPSNTELRQFQQRLNQFAEQPEPTAV